MKKMISVKNLFLTLVASAALVSCGSDDGGGTTYKNLADTANDNGLTTFVAAANLAGVGTFLTGTQKYTVLAPTNSAFNDYLLENGYSGIDAVPTALLREVVLNQIVTGDVQALAFVTGYKKTNAHGPASSTNALSLYVESVSSIKLNGVSTITTADIRASNGRIHVTDKVIPLATIVEHVQANPDLSGLAAALNASPSVKATLSGSGNNSPFTLLAPTNAGMSNLLTAVGANSYSEIPADNLAKILNYHVLGAQNKQYSLIADGSYTTLANQSFTVLNTGGGKKITDVNNRIATFTAATTRDIQAWNGIVQVIDNGLLPGL